MQAACACINISKTNRYSFFISQITYLQKKDYPESFWIVFLLYPYNLSSKFKSKLRHRLKLK